MLNNCTTTTPVFNPAYLPAGPALKGPATAPQATGGFNQDQIALSGKRGPIVIQAEPKAPGPSVNWLDGLLNFLGGLFGGAQRQPAPQPAPAPQAAPQRAPLDAAFERKIDEAFAIRDRDGDGILRGAELQGSDLIDDPAFNLAFDEVNDGEISREAYADRVQAGLPGVRAQQAQHEARQKAEVARLFKEVHGWNINPEAYPFYMGMLKEGKSLEDVKAKMIDFKETRAKYGLSH